MRALVIVRSSWRCSAMMSATNSKKNRRQLASGSIPVNRETLFRLPARGFLKSLNARLFADFGKAWG